MSVDDQWLSVGERSSMNHVLESLRPFEHFQTWNLFSLAATLSHSSRQPRMIHSHPNKFARTKLLADTAAISRF